jgi:hypothetical protein
MAGGGMIVGVHHSPQGQPMLPIILTLAAAGTLIPPLVLSVADRRSGS